MYSRPSTDVSVPPCALRKEYRRAADTLEGPHRTVDTAGRNARRALEILTREIVIRFGCLTSHSVVFVSSPNSQLLRIPRAIRNDVLRAGALEHMPGLKQGFFKLD